MMVLPEADQWHFLPKFHKTFTDYAMNPRVGLTWRKREFYVIHQYNHAERVWNMVVDYVATLPSPFGKPGGHKDYPYQGGWTGGKTKVGYNVTAHAVDPTFNHA